MEENALFEDLLRWITRCPPGVQFKAGTLSANIALFQKRDAV